jgi:hypothetical protein
MQFFRNNSAEKLRQDWSPISQNSFDPKCHTNVALVGQVQVDHLLCGFHQSLDGVVVFAYFSTEIDDLAYSFGNMIH